MKEVDQTNILHQVSPFDSKDNTIEEQDEPVKSSDED